jgi:hypothetical protein
MRIITRVIGLFILIFILSRIDWGGTKEALAGARFFPLILAAGLEVFRLLIDSWRWKYLLYMQNIRYSLRNAFLVYLSSIYFGIITPGRIGNFIRAFYLRNDTKIPIGSALSSVVVDKMLELVVLIGFGWWGLSLLPISRRVFIIWLASLVLLLLLLGVAFSRRFHRIVLKVFSKVAKLGEFTDKTKISLEDFYKGLSYFKDIKIVVPIILTALAFFILFIHGYLIKASLSPNISFIDLAKSISISRLVSRVVSISFSGLGSKDFAIVMLFKRLGINIGKAISFSLLFMSTSYLVSATCGAICWFKKPINLNLSKDSNGYLQKNNK